MAASVKTRPIAPGETHGGLTVVSGPIIQKRERRRGNDYYWIVRCGSCGEERLLLEHSVVRAPKRCKDCWKLPPINAGAKFGNRTVLDGPHPNDKRPNQPLYRVQCDCGDIRLLPGYLLHNGVQQRCHACYSRSMDYSRGVHQAVITKQEEDRLMARYTEVWNKMENLLNDGVKMVTIADEVGLSLKELNALYKRRTPMAPNRTLLLDLERAMQRVERKRAKAEARLDVETVEPVETEETVETIPDVPEVAIETPMEPAPAPVAASGQDLDAVLALMGDQQKLIDDQRNLIDELKRTIDAQRDMLTNQNLTVKSLTRRIDQLESIPRQRTYDVEHLETRVAVVERLIADAARACTKLDTRLEELEKRPEPKPEPAKVTNVEVALQNMLLTKKLKDAGIA